MSCEACDAEPMARHLARGEQSVTPGHWTPRYLASGQDANFSKQLNMQPLHG